MGKIVLHWMNESAAHRVLWLLLELGVPHEVKVHLRDKKTYLSPPELREVHPLGKAPVLEDDGEIIAESAFIVEHLMEKYGQGSELSPKSDEEERKIRFCMHHSGSLVPAEVMLLSGRKLRTEPPFFLRPLTSVIAEKMDQAFPVQDLRRHFDFLEEMLKTNGTGFFVGDHLTAADVLYIFTVQNILLLKDHPIFSNDEYPLLRAWLKQMHQRPALQAAYKQVPEKDPFSDL